MKEVLVPMKEGLLYILVTHLLLLAVWMLCHQKVQLLPQVTQVLRQLGPLLLREAQEEVKHTRRGRVVCVEGIIHNSLEVVACTQKCAVRWCLPGTDYSPSSGEQGHFGTSNECPELISGACLHDHRVSMIRLAS